MSRRHPEALFFKLLRVPGLMRTPVGRRQLRWSLMSRLWPVSRRAARMYRRTICRKPRLVAVVGSFGKTTTARAVAVALGLSAEGIRGLNAGNSLALRLLGVRPSDRWGVLEVGIGKAGQMHTYAEMIRPDITVVTSIGSEHHTSLRTLETTRQEKAEMLRVLPSGGLAVLNGDDPNVRWMRGTTTASAVTFGFDASNDVRATDLHFDGAMGMRFTLRIEGTPHEMATRLVGRHMLYPILAAVAVAVAEQRPLDEVLPALEALEPTPRRLERLRARNGATLLVDTIKSHLETIEAAIESFAGIRPITGRRIVVLGEVEEPPGSLGSVYRALGRHLAGGASLVVFVGGKRALRPLRSGLREGGFPLGAVVHTGRSPRAAAQCLADSLNPEDLVLIKGRSTEHLERVAYALAGREVTCDLAFCSVKWSCGDCPMLARRTP